MQHRNLLPTLVALALLAGLVGCHSQREDALRATLVATNAARDGFTTWDLQHQNKIVDEAKKAHLTETEVRTQVDGYRNKRQEVITFFEAVYKAIAIAAMNKDTPLGEVQKESAALFDSLKQLKELAIDPLILKPNS